MRKTALLGTLAALLLTWAWLRLELREAPTAVLLWALAAGVAPALPSSWRLRAAAVAVAAIVVLRETLGSARPGVAIERFDDGFKLFFDVQLPFVPEFHPKMHGLVLLGVVGFTLAVTLAVAARRPLLAGGLLVAGAGWPTTLLHGDRPLRDGAIILGGALLIVAGIGSTVRARQAAVASLAVIVAAVGIATLPAVAKGAFLAWEEWDPYAAPERQVSVSYVWDTTYRPLTFPKKKTVVFRVQAPPVSRYWRATTLDMFHGEAWIEFPHQTYREPPRFTPLTPGSARNPTRQLRVRVEIAGLQDTHLLGPSVPIDFETDFETVLFQDTGTATVPEGIPRGSAYNAISFLPRPSPARLLRSRPIYNTYHELYREVQQRWQTSLPPAFGASGRDARMADFFRREQLLRPYRPLYDIARQVVGTTTSPYLAAVRLEDWFRTGGGFSYDESPRAQRRLPTLVHFVTRSRSGYCQHFASSMTLMLRYLGIPSRVAAGFTSGTYDQKTREWTVTDHDAHTWVEVWFRGFGWLPFDPTPGRGTLDGSYSAASNRFDPAALAALGTGLDAADKKLEGGGLDRVGRTADSARDVPGDVATAPQEDASLLRLLALLALGALAVVTVAKQVWRHARFLTRDPRRAAAACRRELADFLADQRFDVQPSATVAELGEIARHELGVNPEPFVSAVNAARYGPPERSGASARAARRELRRLQRDIRRRLSHLERARGLVSLRSFGIA